MIEWWKQIAETLALGARVAAIALIVAGALLFVPAPLLDRFGLGHIAREQLPLISAAALIAAAILLVDISRAAWRGLSSQLKRRADRHEAAAGAESKKRVAREAISALTESEKAILREFKWRARHAIDLPVEDGEVTLLIRRSILIPLATEGEMGYLGVMIPCKISDYAASLLDDATIGWPADERAQKALPRAHWVETSKRI